MPPKKRPPKKKRKNPTRPPDRRPKKKRPQASALRAFQVGDGLPNLTDLRSELQDYTDVLLGRESPPVNNGVLTLMEYADACFARASEMTMLIQRGEQEGHIPKNSSLYKFRTGELRTFLEMAKRAADMGSRRLTATQLQLQLKQDAEMLGFDITDLFGD